MKSRFTLSCVLALILAQIALAQNVGTKRVADFTLPDIDGRNVTLSKNFGRGPIYISFWATWCKPCVEELKIIEKLYEKYKDRGFQVIAINTEGPRAAAKIKSFVKSYGINFMILLDNDGEIFRRIFKGNGMPFTILTNAEGKIIFSGVGFKPGDEVNIEKLIISNLLPSAADSTKKDEAGN